jgi:hypothetical protein
LFASLLFLSGTIWKSLDIFGKILDFVTILKWSRILPTPCNGRQLSTHLLQEHEIPNISDEIKTIEILNWA